MPIHQSGKFEVPKIEDVKEVINGKAVIDKVEEVADTVATELAGEAKAEHIVQKDEDVPKKKGIVSWFSKYSKKETTTNGTTATEETENTATTEVTDETKTETVEQEEETPKKKAVGSWFSKYTKKTGSLKASPKSTEEETTVPNGTNGTSETAPEVSEESTTTPSSNGDVGDSEEKKKAKKFNIFPFRKRKTSKKEDKASDETTDKSETEKSGVEQNQVPAVNGDAPSTPIAKANGDQALTVIGVPVVTPVVVSEAAPVAVAVVDNKVQSNGIDSHQVVVAEVPQAVVAELPQPVVPEVCKSDVPEVADPVVLDLAEPTLPDLPKPDVSEVAQVEPDSLPPMTLPPPVEDVVAVLEQEMPVQNVTEPEECISEEPTKCVIDTVTENSVHETDNTCEGGGDAQKSEETVAE